MMILCLQIARKWLSLLCVCVKIAKEVKEMFKLHSNFEPTGDQPEAIAKLVDGIKKGDRAQTLLGVTRFWKNIHYGKYYTKSSKANAYFST